MALILVVDDSMDDLAIISNYLKSIGHDCRLATSGRDGLELLSVEKFQLVLSDLLMERGDGEWLLKELSHSINPPPFIMMTADRSRHDHEFVGQGAHGLVHKPFIWHQLKQLIDQALAK